MTHSHSNHRHKSTFLAYATMLLMGGIGVTSGLVKSSGQEEQIDKEKDVKPAYELNTVPAYGPSLSVDSVLDRADRDPLILRVNEVMAGADGGITLEDKLKFLKEIGIKTPIDENEPINFFGPKDGMYTLFYVSGGYGRHTGAGEKGFAGQVSTVALERYAKTR